MHILYNVYLNVHKKLLTAESTDLTLQYVYGSRFDTKFHIMQTYK